jgi:transposase
LAETIGQDGYHLLACVYAGDAPAALRGLSAVEILRRIWVQNYYIDQEGPHWRDKDQIPPPAKRISSPYDPQARYSVKREVFWLGYKAHFTETCDAEGPILITHVETAPATEQEVRATARIQQALVEKDLPPREHITDAGYVSSDLIVESQIQHDIELLGPVGLDQSWQVLAGAGFDQAHFTIDWEAQTATCPQGKTSTAWYSHLNHQGDDTIRVRFHHADCQLCPTRAQCTRSQSAGRTLTLLPKAQYLALQAARDYQKTEDFKTRYTARAGVEGTISQAVHTLHMRRARYIGLAKTHLQHLATAAAINLSRAIAWLWEAPRSRTPKSRFAALAP